MVALTTWLRYISTKFDYSLALTKRGFSQGRITEFQLLDTVWRNVLLGKLTFVHWNKGEEMVPTVGTNGGTFLVRKIAAAGSRSVHIGDVVLLKDPVDSANLLVRRLAAIEGYEMASSDDKDEPFFLEKDQCWVLADNEKLKPKEAYDSRTFGPVTMADIVGRAIYVLRSSMDHGPVDNSHFSRRKDSPVLEVELDVNELAKNHRA